jgi:Thiolase C-terminal domain-like
MKQSPVYVLNHLQHNLRKRSTGDDLDEIEDWTDRAAKRMYEGAGLGPEEVDAFNPYDGYAAMAQFFLEGFQWHGVKRGDAFAFYAGDIRVEGPHPFSSSGGNLGTGAAVPPCTPTASSSCAAPPAPARSGFGQKRHWRLDHVR